MELELELEFDELLELEFELEFDELLELEFELEFDELLELEFELEFDELLELELELEFDELLELEFDALSVRQFQGRSLFVAALTSMRPSSRALILGRPSSGLGNSAIPLARAAGAETTEAASATAVPLASSLAFRPIGFVSLVGMEPVPPKVALGPRIPVTDGRHAGVEAPEIDRPNEAGVSRE